MLAEFEPWFELQEKTDASEHKRRKFEILSLSAARAAFLGELNERTGISLFFGSAATYDLLVGTQPDLYRAFMIRTWRNIGEDGSVGLLHPDTHFVGDREKFLRADAYARLRVHGDFTNPGNRFFPPPVDRHTHFGMHIYAKPREIGFAHLSWLLSANELPQSLAFAEAGTVPRDWGNQASLPGIRYQGDWDARPHPARVIWVDRGMLSSWQSLSRNEEQPVEYTRLLNPLSTYEQDAIAALGRIDRRLAAYDPPVSSGYSETAAVKDGLMRWEVCSPGEWQEVILKGAQITIATPFFKQPPETGVKGRPPSLVDLPVDAIPRSEYVRVTDVATYRNAQDVWMDPREPGSKRRYTDFYRVMWRRMIADNTDRSLFAAIIPPGPAHVDAVNSLMMPTLKETTLVAGFWAALPLDYLLRITGRADFRASDVRQMPAPAPDHPLAAPLLLRTLRLNCLTNAYGDLWNELYDDAWRAETWTAAWPSIAPLGDVTPTWQRLIPFRTEYERRAALVEIDALVAVWLGITETELEAIYPARFPVLGDYEDVTWFDANARKIAGNWNTYGTGQTKEHWEQFLAWREAPEKNPVPEGYVAPFYKADRIDEYRQAHAAFTERMNRAQA